MSKTMLINVTHVEESRVAILEDGVLAAYEIETINRTSIKGNIYNSVVESVHPALEAAFVKIAPDLKGFLPLDEINTRLLPQRREDRSKGKIGQHLSQGQRLITQVVREPFAGKPPTVSTYFSLPGRYLVLMPGVDSSGISRKIEDAQQRDRLKQIVDELNPPDGFGLIVRTAGIGQTKTELQRDLRYLLRLWESIQKGSGSAPFPGLVYQERDLVIRTIRDHFTPDISEVWIDNPQTFAKAEEFVRDVMPTKTKLLKLHSGDRPLFNKHNLEEQIERIYKRRVPLPSGGEIVIDGTEALTAIDVNSARSSKKADAEDNAARTNLEAADEIARQLRLRDLGGLIVIDFIDMMKKGNIKKVETAMKAAMRGDRARHDITRISKLGLMEIARQRIKGAKLGASYATCPTCDGFGLIKNIETAALAALRKLQTRATRGSAGTLAVCLPPEVAEWILNHKREDLVHLERRTDLRIVIEAVPTMLRHESRFEMRAGERGESAPGPAADDRSQAPTPAEIAAAELAARGPAEDEPEAGPADATAGEPEPSGEDGGEKKKRRRRRRRRRSGGNGDRAEGAEGEEPDDDDGTAIDAASDGDEPAGDGDEDGEADRADDDTGDRAVDAGGEDGEPTRRRRRRRRRRGRGGRGADPDGGAPEAPTETSEGTTPREAPEPQDDADSGPVPSGVRSDELMPAAAGGAGGAGRRGRRGRRGGRGRSGSGTQDG